MNSSQQRFSSGVRCQSKLSHASCTSVRQSPCLCGSSEGKYTRVSLPMMYKKAYRMKHMAGVLQGKICSCIGDEHDHFGASLSHHWFDQCVCVCVFFCCIKLWTDLKNPPTKLTVAIYQFGVTIKFQFQWSPCQILIPIPRNKFIEAMVKLQV